MTELNVTKTGVISSGGKVDGVEYMSDKAAAAHLRKVGHDPIYSHDGEVIAKSRHAITAAEQKTIDKQVVRVGPHKGKTLGDIKKAQAAA